MSQTADIIEFIKVHGSITTKQAMENIGCYRLSGRIHEMKQTGIQIEREMVTVPRRDGTLTRVARYTITGGVPDCFTP